MTRSSRPLRIVVLYTGGTIGMRETAAGLRPGADLAGWLDTLLRDETPPVESHLHVYDPLIDSSDASPSDWQRIIDDIRHHAQGIDGILVLHGTDTMSYTAAALDFALADLRVPVIITGSQLPLSHPRSDAAENVLGAIRCLASVDEGVGLFFSGTLFQGARVQKVSLDTFEGFSSPNFPPAGRVSTEGVYEGYLPLRVHGPGYSAAEAAARRPYTRDPDQEVVVCFLTPGIRTDRLRAMLTPAPAGVLLLGYGAGNAPQNDPDLPEIVSCLTDVGTVTVVCSQCHSGRVDLSTYATGSGLARAGAISAERMTIEAAYAKLKMLLAQGYPPVEVRGRFLLDLVGEI